MHVLLVLDAFDALGRVFVVSNTHARRSSRDRAKHGTLPSVQRFPFAYRQRVRFGETDTQQVVYYANYLLYAEVGRIAYLRELGIEYQRHFVSRGIDFTIGEAHVKYRAPLRFDDEFDIKVRVGELRHSAWSFEYAIDRADGLHCADVNTVQVCISGEPKRATRMPDELRRVLEDAKGAEHGLRAP